MVEKCNATVWRRVFVQQPCMREAEEDGKCCKHTKAAIVKRGEQRQKDLSKLQDAIKDAVPGTPDALLTKVVLFVEKELAKDQDEESDDDSQ